MHDLVWYLILAIIVIGCVWLSVRFGAAEYFKQRMKYQREFLRKLEEENETTCKGDKHG